MNARIDKSEWLSVHDVAVVLGIDDADVRGLIHAGVLEGYQIGRVYRVRGRELERYIIHWQASRRRPL